MHHPNEAHGKQQQLRNQEHVDWWIHEQRDGWTLKNNVMGCLADICVERILQSTVATGKSASTKIEDIEYHHP